MSNMAQASTMSATSTVSQIVNSSYKPVPNPLQFLPTSSNEEDVVSSPSLTTTTTTTIAANVPRTTAATTAEATLTTTTTKPTAKKAPTPTIATNTTTKTIKINNEIILSLKEPQYKDLLWTKFNTLGKTRNHTLEEQTGLEIYNHFMKQDSDNGSSVTTTTKFYRLNRKEEKLLLSNDEAVEREFIVYYIIIVYVKVLILISVLSGSMYLIFLIHYLLLCRYYTRSQKEIRNYT